jgi:hypothetical protein
MITTPGHALKSLPRPVWVIFDRSSWFCLPVHVCFCPKANMMGRNSCQ